MKKLDFNILQTGNPQTLVFVDESNYAENSVIFPTLQIKFPNIDRVYKVLIRTEKVNAIYTNMVGFSTAVSDFPDGLYELRYSIEPHSTSYVCKKYMKVDSAYKKLSDIICKITNKDDKYFNKLGEINLLLLSSQLEANCNCSLANEEFALANKLISKLSC